MAPWDFPPEYGNEEGQPCDRGRCRTRICYVEPECDGGADCEDNDPDAETGFCELTHEGVLYCPSGCWSSDAD
jgi:hypothetical protein